VSSKKIECFDIGGTYIRGAIIENGKIISYLRVNSTSGKGKKELIKKICFVSKTIRKQCCCRKVLLTVLAVPGPIENGIAKSLPPLKINFAINFQSELAHKLKNKIVVENDLKVATYAELKKGLGSKHKHFYLLSISTGIGSGVVINRSVLMNNSGEYGHCVIERNKNANRCPCGSVGCWVAHCSGIGLEITFKKILKKNLSPQDFFSLAENGNRQANQILSKIREYNAQAIGIMCNAFEVSLISVMGSIGLNQFHKVIPSRNEIQQYTINTVPDILPSILGENIGLFGAFFLGVDRITKKVK
jgi:predicted NBD/HSP70 family sugar kinase